MKPSCPCGGWSTCIHKTGCCSHSCLIACRIACVLSLVPSFALPRDTSHSFVRRHPHVIQKVPCHAYTIMIYDPGLSGVRPASTCTDKHGAHYFIRGSNPRFFTPLDSTEACVDIPLVPLMQNVSRFFSMYLPGVQPISLLVLSSASARCIHRTRKWWRI